VASVPRKHPRLLNHSLSFQKQKLSECTETRLSQEEKITPTPFEKKRNNQRIRKFTREFFLTQQNKVPYSAKRSVSLVLCEDL